MRQNDLLGPWGEVQAVDFLRAKKYAILATNYRSRFGEIDIIAKAKGIVAFVEVKLRKTDTFGAAREFVGAGKQERIKKTAMLWLEQYDPALQPRFDVIEIYAPEGLSTKRPSIEHIEDAFQ